LDIFALFERAVRKEEKREAGGCVGTVEDSYLTLGDLHPSRSNSPHRAARTKT
jgi:hypothetical protein